MTEDTIYMKLPQNQWIKQPMPFSQEVFQQQKDISSDPLMAAQQMKDFGLILSYGNDVSQKGKDYYASTVLLIWINSGRDMKK